MTRNHWNGWACVDCLMLLANGETPPEMGEDETAAWLAEIGRRMAGTETVTLGRLIGEDGCDCIDWDTVTHREGCEKLEFSYGQCDYCGSRFGGERAAITGWLASA